MCLSTGKFTNHLHWNYCNMSFKTNEEILSTFSLLPQHFTTDHYRTIFTDVSWYSGYINSMIYVAINTVISLVVALPAAYAFSRYSFLGDKHVFFWLLTNRMTPPAVFLLPFFQLYSTMGMMDTHIAVALAHLLFNVPLAVWILEGFMSGIPREIDETAYIDGYSFPRFFVTIFIPLIKAGVGVAAFFCFMAYGGVAVGQVGGAYPVLSVDGDDARAARQGRVAQGSVRRGDGDLQAQREFQVGRVVAAQTEAQRQRQDLAGAHGLTVDGDRQ